MKNRLLSIVLGALLVTPLFAGTVKIPKDEPIASITFPAKWEVTEEDESIEAVSPDEAVSFSIEVIDTDSVEAALKESLAYLEKEKVKVKESTVKKNEGKINDIPVVDMSFDGTDKEGPCKISLAFFVISENQCLSVLYWASEEGEQKNQKALAQIAKSVKRVAAKEKKEEEEEKEK